MARTVGEIEFSKMLGDLGEELAPELLQRMGVTEIRNLNRPIKNFPWADYSGKTEQGYAGVAVRTRIKWEKPQPGKIGLNYSYNGAGEKKMAQARSEIATFYGVDPGNVAMLWLAIAIDLDDTYDAYWGHSDEMQRKASGEEGMYIRMRSSSLEEYARQRRRLAVVAPVAVPWLDYSDNWTYPARLKWIELASIADREERILHAIRSIAPTVEAA